MAKTNNAKNEVEEKKRKNRRKHPLLPNRPKNACTSFGSFMRESWPTLNAKIRKRPGQALKGVAVRWNELTPERKMHYQNLVVADRMRYNTEIARWKRVRAFLTGPAKPFTLFSKEVYQREKNNNSNAKLPQLGKLAGEEWHKLTAAQKNQYYDRYEMAKINYYFSVLDFEAGFEVDLDRELDTEEMYIPERLEEHVPHLMEESDLYDDDFDTEEEDDASEDDSTSEDGYATEDDDEYAEA